MFRTLPPFGGDQRQTAEIIRGIMDGKTNNTGTLTLATGGATTTTLNDRRIGGDSVILFVPDSAVAFADSIPYGAFQSVVDQTLAAANTAYAMTLDTIDVSNGVTLSNSSRMNVKNAGVYNFQWSGQFQNTDTQEHDASVWLRKNGTNVVGSTGLIGVPSSHGGIDGHTVIGWNYFIDLAANDYIELYWSSPSTQVSLQFYAAGTSPTRPTTASLITTMNLVSSSGTSGSSGLYVSSLGQGTATVTHYANSTANKTYKYVVIG
jgi:hypothetical protein